MRAIRFPGCLSQVQAGRPLARHASRRTRIAERDSWVQILDLCCRRWHPAKTTGVLRIASSVLHILCKPLRDLLQNATTTLVLGQRQRRNVSARKISGTLLRLSNTTSPETHFTTASPRASAIILRNSRHTASLDELAELINYSNSSETSSTHLFASQSQSGRDQENRDRKFTQLDLPERFPQPAC
jgi:hypothetical protein